MSPYTLMFKQITHKVHCVSKEIQVVPSAHEPVDEDLLEQTLERLDEVAMRLGFDIGHFLTLFTAAVFR